MAPAGQWHSKYVSTATDTQTGIGLLGAVFPRENLYGGFYQDSFSESWHAE